MHPYPNIIPDRDCGLAGMSVTWDGVQVNYNFKYDQHPKEPGTPEVLKKCQNSQGPRGPQGSPVTPCPGPANNRAPSTDRSKDTPPGFKSIPVARKLTFGSEAPMESPSGDSGHSITDGFTNKTKVKDSGVSHMVNDSSVGSLPSN